MNHLREQFVLCLRLQQAGEVNLRHWSESENDRKHCEPRRSEQNSQAISARRFPAASRFTWFFGPILRLYRSRWY
jgi:hypothetical protein